MAEQPQKTEIVQKAEPVQTVSPAAAVKKPVVAKKKAKKSTKVTFARGKRKTAVARVSATPGKGSIRINSKDISLINPAETRDLMIEAINISKRAQELASKVDMTVNVQGGGASGQAQAVRIAIAKCLVELDGSEVLKDEFLGYDRSLLVEDPRRVEPKKFLGPKARARNQTSYR
jgi:small subunit ribosomal protein S9